MKKNILYYTILAALAAVIFIPGVREALKEQFLPVATIEKAVTLSEDDYSLKLKGINVPDADLKDFKGKKVLFLNFWGTWCAPCRKEWPSIQALYDSKKDKTDFVLIAMQDKEEDVRAFLAKNNYTVPVYLAESPISESILPKAFPTTFLVSKDGHILFKEDATRDWNAPSVHQMIESVSK